MQQIAISDETFARLQRLARPFVDTPESVIQELIDFREKAGTVLPPPKPEIRKFPKDSIPPLIFSKPTQLKFGEIELEIGEWNQLLRFFITAAKRKEISASAIAKIAGANIITGKKTDKGYKYISEVDTSYQGVSADDAIRYTIRIAENLKVPTEIEWQWSLNSPKAFAPGEKGRVII